MELDSSMLATAHHWTVGTCKRIENSKTMNSRVSRSSCFVIYAYLPRQHFLLTSISKPASNHNPGQTDRPGQLAEGHVDCICRFTEGIVMKATIQAVDRCYGNDSGYCPAWEHNHLFWKYKMVEHFFVEYYIFGKLGLQSVGTGYTTTTSILCRFSDKGSRIETELSLGLG